MTTQLDDFETRLLHILREQVAQRETTAARRSRGPRRVVLTVVAVAAAATGLLFIPGLGTSPAYSVQEGNAGEILVEINAPTDASGLERALQEHGIAADVTYLPELQTCAPGRYVDVDRPLSGLTTMVGNDSIGVTIPPGAIRDGETFVLSWSVLPMSQTEIDALNSEIEEGGGTTTEGTHVTLTAGVAAGSVQPCIPVRRHQPLPDPATTRHTWPATRPVIDARRDANPTLDVLKAKAGANPSALRPPPKVMS